MNPTLRRNPCAPALLLEGDVDHVNPEKFAFRRDALAHDRRRTKIIEFYAGVGYLTAGVYARAYRELVAVEKDAAHFRRLVKAVARFANVHYYNKDNRDFIAQDLADHLDFSAADFDSFGAAGETVQLFFGALAGRSVGPFLVLLTDGGLLAVRRRARMNLYRHYLAGPDEVRPAPADLGARFERFQAAFVARAAARAGLRAKFLDARRNHNETVLYSAFTVTPASR
jgi:hypothetical protein